MVKSDILSIDEISNRQFKPHYVWIYVTERCDLNCEYCYFRHRQQRDISNEHIEKLFLRLEKEQTHPLMLVLSGGEPFLVKERVFGILKEARQRFPKTALHIQTNGLLIDDESIQTLRDLGVSLEFGIDGDCEQTVCHRRGLNEELFQQLTNTIRACLNAGISCGCTMAIHPDEIQNMGKGIDFIHKLGIPKVDVTPAAFMPWTPELIKLFKRKYLDLFRKAHIRNIVYAHDDGDWIAPGCMDLSLHPPGYLLGGDAFLCLSEEARRRFNLWDAAIGEWSQDILSFYQDFYAHRRGDNDCILYREHLCQSFDLVNVMMGEEYMNSWAINDILRFQTRVHRALLRPEGRIPRL